MTHIPYLTSTVGPANDRRTRLLVMGIVLLVIAGFCLLITVGTTILLLLRPGGMPAMPWQRVITQLLVYGGIAALFTSLGLGSIFRRRWARPVVLAIAWPWLIGGACGTAAVIFTMSQIMGINSSSPGIGGSSEMFIILMSSIVAAAFYVGLPLAFILTYHSPQVQSTLDFYDPHPRWTDGVPIRVLSLCVIMLGSVLGVLANAFVAVMPFFGILLRGPIAIAMMLLMAAIFLLASWWCYLLQMRGWLLSLALFLLMPISAGITFYRISAIDLYKAMGSSDRELEMMRQMNLSRAGQQQMLVLAVFGAVLGVGYLLLVRKCFTSKPSSPEPPMAQSLPPEEIA